LRTIEIRFVDEVVKSFVGDGFTIVLYTAIVQR
jgi:hypothetical protein